MKWFRSKAILLSGLLVGGLATDACADQGGRGAWPDVVLPEVTTKVRLSNTDVNRLVCPGGIRDVVFSQEKGVKVRISGNNAFIKFQVIKKGEEMIYTEVPSEFHVVCGGDIYSLIGMPQRVPAKTVRLSSGKKQKVRHNLALFSGMPLEKKVLTLIRQAYTDQLPESYLVRSVGKQMDLFPNLWLSHRRDIVVEGEGLAVREYMVSLKEGDGETRLSEREFLRPALTTRPLAIAVEELLLRQGNRSRVFIVERRDTDAPSPFVRRHSDQAESATEPQSFFSAEEVTDAP